MTDTDKGQDRLESPEEMAAATSSASRSPFSSRKRLDRARELVRAIAVASTNASLYPAAHPALVQSVDDLVTAVCAVMDLGFDELTINVFKRTLFVEDHVLPEESATYSKLIDDLLNRGISAVTISDDFSRTDSEALTALLVADGVTDIETAQDFLDGHGGRAITVAETTTLEDESTSERARENKARARRSYDGGLVTMRDVETRVKLGKVFDVEPLQAMVNGLLEQLFTDPAAVLGLTAIKSHDDYTLNHAINVCILSISLGATLGLDEESLKSLGLSALLYDLGKVRIPEDILNKEGPLTADEWQIIKSHAAEGADLLKRIQLVDQMPMIVAYEHHQRHDLQGYPDTIGGQEQHLFSKVVALCDAYDAMTTSRPFRREIRPDKSLAVLMQGRGKAYDPSITKAFVAMLGIYPMGAVVRLSDASVAVVFRVNRDDLLRPRVKVLVDPDGRWMEDTPVVDLRVSDGSATALEISEAMPASDAGIDDVWEYL
ncbi:MAG: HD-GYP domain-containing protein [Coriobacteriia bacterium]|nr:HD-GYP domain-containing protein [Coriobacteriia bacterium]